MDRPDLSRLTLAEAEAFRRGVEWMRARAAQVARELEAVETHARAADALRVAAGAIERVRGPG